MIYHFRDPFDFSVSQNIISFKVEANGKFGPTEEFFNISKYLFIFEYESIP
jgi:hypothetical protein